MRSSRRAARPLTSSRARRRLVLPLAFPNASAAACDCGCQCEDLGDVGNFQARKPLRHEKRENGAGKAQEQDPMQCQEHESAGPRRGGICRQDRWIRIRVHPPIRPPPTKWSECRAASKTRMREMGIRHCESYSAAPIMFTCICTRGRASATFRHIPFYYMSTKKWLTRPVSILEFGRFICLRNELLNCMQRKEVRRQYYRLPPFASSIASIMCGKYLSPKPLVFAIWKV